MSALLVDARDFRLSGNRLIFSAEDDPLFKILELDLATGELTTIVLDTLFSGGHDVSGDRIAWFDAFGLATEDRSDGIRVRYPGWNGGQISLDGDRAAFAGGDGTRTGIMLADLSTGSIDQLATRGRDPSLRGDRVAWLEQFRGVILGTRSVIKLFDAATGDTTAIANEGRGMLAPVIGESVAAWSVDEGTWDVFAHDFDTGPFAVATGPTDQRAVAVLTGSIAWLQDREPRAGRFAVHLLNLATGEVRRVSDWGVVFLAADSESLLWRDGEELIHFTPR